MKTLRLFKKYTSERERYKRLYELELEKSTKLEEQLADIKKRSIAPLDVTSILNHHKQIDTRTVKTMIKRILGDL